MGGYIPEFDRNGIKVVDIQLGTGICVPSTRDEDKDENMTKITEDKKLGVWRAPFVHSFFDTRVVRRSNMLQADLGNQPYGAALSFMEYAMLPPEQVAAAKRSSKEGRGDEQAKPMGQYGMTLEEEEAMLKSEGREFKEGEGPALEDMSDAWSGFFLHAESTNGNQVKCSFVGADGYFETSRVAVETALTLRFDREKLPYKGGVLTPSTAGSTPLVDRLIASGVKFKMGEWMESSDLAPPSMP
uniref:Saccharopine dehydrogenase-like C-terminal domain-containing protein n=1 Tax=Alexandrium monilatum TaxID=311494 RepID=A0A6T1LM78_9DINO